MGDRKYLLYCLWAEREKQAKNSLQLRPLGLYLGIAMGLLTEFSIISRMEITYLAFL